MLLSGADGRENHVVWVSKQEINVSMLYPMNWKLSESLYEVTDEMSLVIKSLKNGCNSGKDFSK